MDLIIVSAHPPTYFMGNSFLVPDPTPAPVPAPISISGFHFGDFGNFGDFGDFTNNSSESSSPHSKFIYIIGFVVVGIVFVTFVVIWCLCKKSKPEDSVTSVNFFLQNMDKERPCRYTSQQLKKYTKGFSEKLGSGGFGVVYKGLLPEGVSVAVKVLNNNLTEQLVEEQFMAEVSSIGRTYHLNLVRLFGYCFELNLKSLVYEFMPNGSLDHLLFGETEIDWENRYSVALGTAKGIAYLHEDCQHRIIHYDIKPGNVLLDSSMNPKVADFGLARLSNKDSTHVVISGFKGSPGYAAPEVWTSYVTHKCDVYSFGMMLFEIVGRRRNHVRELSGTTKEWLPKWTYQKLKDEKVTEMLDECGVVNAGEKQAAERALKVALWCVQYSPGERPEMSTVVKMLDGGMEVPMPHNPFGYLEQTFDFGEDSGCSHGFSSTDQDLTTFRYTTNITHVN